MPSLMFENHVFKYDLQTAGCDTYITLKMVDFPDVPKRMIVVRQLRERHRHAAIKWVRPIDDEAGEFDYFVCPPGSEVLEEFHTSSAADFVDYWRSESGDEHYLVKGLIRPGQYGVEFARPKCCKTISAIDLAVSISTGTPFLSFPTSQTEVLYCYSEGMPRDISNRILRAAKAKDISPHDLQYLHICSKMPRLGDNISLQQCIEEAERLEAEFLIFDCVYAQMPGVNTSLVNDIGYELKKWSDAAQSIGAGLHVVHHTKKEASRRHQLPELSDISGSGFSEWCRYWFGLSRREKYDFSGHHKLWAAFGSSSGFGMVAGLDIVEGNSHDVPYSAQLLSAEQIAAAKAEKKRFAIAGRDITLEKNCEQFLDELAKHPEGETASSVCDAAGLNSEKRRAVIELLKKRGAITKCRVKKSSRSYPGWKVELGQLGQEKIISCPKSGLLSSEAQTETHPLI